MLTAKKVERAKKPGRYGDGHGLYLQVVNPANKSWLLRYERDGRKRWMGLGPTHTVTLKEARERARQARLLLLDGIDPLDRRNAQRVAVAAARAKALTFVDATHAYFDQHEGKWRNAKHAAQFMSTLKTFAFPIIGALNVADVDTPLILKVLRQPVAADRGYPAGPFWQARPETASRLRGRIEAVIGWATVSGYRSGDNPARWKGHLSEALPARGQIQKTNHHAALPYREIPSLMAALRTREGTAARALEFAILTAARTGEAIGARRDEIDLADRTWAVPAGRMKAGKQHRVPLNERAVELLRTLPTETGNAFVFIGPRGGSGLSNMALTAVLHRMGFGHVTAHGFRSSFRDWAAEQTNHSNHVVEMALAHAVGDKVEAAYRRGDLFQKRRALMDAWAQYCMSPPLPASADVVPMRPSKAAANV